LSKKSLSHILKSFQSTCRNLNHLYIKGSSKFELELEHVKKLNPNKMLKILRHEINDSGEGEPSKEEEMIEQNISKEMLTML